MAKYYYEKWSGERKNTNYKITGETILSTRNIVSDITLGTWFPSSGIVSGIRNIPSKEFGKSPKHTSYKKHPSGYFYDYEPQISGGYVSIGEEGYSFLNYTGGERDAVYKAEYLSTEGSFSHTVSVKGWWYLNFIREDIYEYFFKTTLQNIIIAEDGLYPSNGLHTDGYWYVKKGLAFPDFKMKVDGQLKTSENGWVKVGNELKGIDKIWIKVGGILKEI